MSIVIEKDKYLYYKQCEENLKRILNILKDDEFLAYHDPIHSHKDTADIWDYFIIDIFYNANITKEKANESNI